MSIPTAEAHRLHELVISTPGGIASRILGKTSGGNLTLFTYKGGKRDQIAVVQ